ncbi:MAG: hypothetical protein ACR2QV_03465 [Gammaproteobacteria bacterium]
MEESKPQRDWRLRFNQTGVFIIIACGLLAILPSVFSYSVGAIVTLSVTATTESIELELKPERKYSWRLPPGAFALLSGGGDGCSGEEPDILCEFTHNTTVRVSGGPTLTLETLPDGSFVASLVPVADRPVIVEVVGPDGDELASTTELAFFESVPGAPELRLPMIVDSATLGSLLHESAGDMGPTDSIWQPMLREGEYSVFASVGENRDRFRLLDGEFDPGDVIEMQSRPGDKQGGDAAIWGHVSVVPSEEGASVLRANLHTPHAELAVRRFGAPDGYTIKTPPWQVLSQLPAWQSSWVIFVSLLLIYDVYCAASERNHRWNRQLLARRRSEARRKAEKGVQTDSEADAEAGERHA